MEDDWRKWCRLCAKEDNVLNYVNVFSSNHGQSILDSWSGELNISAAIGKFFSVNISRYDDMPKVICGECFALLSKFFEFSERIVKVQHMFCLLQSKFFDKTSMAEVRIKCSLVDEDQKIVVPASPTTVLKDKEEVYCFDENHDGNYVGNLQEEDTENENPLDSLRVKSKVFTDLIDNDPVENCELDDNERHHLGKRGYRRQKKNKLHSSSAGKSVKPNPCKNKKCGNDCAAKISEDDRQTLNEHFWGLSKTQQRDWLTSCIKQKEIKRRRVMNSRRNISYEYVIRCHKKDIKVCQQFVLKTLNVSQQAFRKVMANLQSPNIKRSSKRHNKSGQEKVDEEDV